MKKIRLLRIAVMCCVFSLLCLSALGCTGTTVADTEQSQAEELLEELIDNEDYIVVGFVQVGSESDWRNANTDSYTSVFTEENGYYLILEDGQQKQENQLKSVRSLILQQVDYIVLDPIVETGWDAVLQEAKDAGIPVIVADRMVDVEDDDLYTCWIGSDFYKEGTDAGEWLVSYLEAMGRGAEDLNIVVLQGTEGSSAQLGRTAGFAAIAETMENWHILESSSGDFTTAKGKEVMEYFLQTYDAIDVVISENDNMTFGAMEAIWEAGKTCGEDGDIIIVSFDAVKDAIVAISEGTLNATFECNPLLGSAVEQIILDLEAGKTVEKIQYVEETYFDATMDLLSILEERLY